MDPRLLLIARNLQRLRKARENADYSFLTTVTWVNADECLWEALEACQALKQIASDPDIISYLLLPLLRDQKRRG